MAAEHLLRRWTLYGRREDAEVAEDALRNLGLGEAADDLHRAEFEGNRRERGRLQYRATLRPRILAELRGARFLSRGDFLPGREGYTTSEYVALYDPHRGGFIFKHAFPQGRSNLELKERWQLWGTYPPKDFRSERELLRTMQSDIRYESLPYEARTAQRGERKAILARTSKRHRVLQRMRGRSKRAAADPPPRHDSERSRLIRAIYRATPRDYRTRTGGTHNVMRLERGRTALVTLEKLPTTELRAWGRRR